MQHSDIININKELKDLYLLKKYDQYRDLLVKNKSLFDQSQFYYNLGTIDIKLKNYGFARYHIENSIMKGKMTTETYHNLKVVKQHLTPEKVSLKAEVIFQSKIIPIDLWLIFSLIGGIILVFLLKYRKLRNVWVIGGLLFISLAPIGYKYLYLDNQNIAITLSKVSFQEGPTKLFSKIGEIPIGKKLLLNKHNGNWWLIAEPEEYSGWVNSKNLGFL